MLSRRATIATNTFCGQCGYNLKTLAIFGRCPECGNVYDSRATVQEGILRDEDIHFPWAGVAGSLLSGAIGAGGIIRAVQKGATWAWVPAVAFILLFLLFVIITYRHAAQFIRHRLLLRAAMRSDDG